MAQPCWLCGTGSGRPSPLRVALFATLLLLLLLGPQPVAAQTNYTVNQAYDLAYAFWSKADIIYIYDSIQITLDNFPTTSVTVVNHSVEIRPHPAVENTTIVSIDFGNLITNRVLLQQGSNVTICNLRIVNFYFPVTEDLAVSSFVPFFSFDATSNLIVDNDDFAVDATRCASSPDYPAFVASTRTPWLMATHPDVFEGCLENDTYYCDHAIAPLNYFRANLTTVVGVPTAGECHITLCRWTCEVTSLPLSLYDIVTRAYTSNDILVALSYTDSRTIYLHENMTTSLGAWGPDDLTVANFREITLAGDPSVEQPTLWEIEDSDLLQVGYAGTLTFEDMTVFLTKPCCSQIPDQLGSWFFLDVELDYQVFDVVLPSAINVQPVRVPILTLPAKFVAQDIHFVYKQCDAVAFPAAVAQMQIIASQHTYNSTETPQVFSFDNETSTLTCEYCMWQAAQQPPAFYQDAVSTAELINSTVTCLSFVMPSPNSTAASASAARGQPNTGKAGWGPSTAVVIVAVLIATAIAALMGFVSWRLMRARRRNRAAAGPKGTLAAAPHLRSPAFDNVRKSDSLSELQHLRSSTAV